MVAVLGFLRLYSQSQIFYNLMYIVCCLKHIIEYLTSQKQQNNYEKIAHIFNQNISFKFFYQF